MEAWVAQVEDNLPQRWMVLLVEGGGQQNADVGALRHFLKVVLQCNIRARGHATARSLVMQTASVRESALLLLTLHKTIHKHVHGTVPHAAGIIPSSSALHTLPRRGPRASYFLRSGGWAASLQK